MEHWQTIEHKIGNPGRLITHAFAPDTHLIAVFSTAYAMLFQNQVMCSATFLSVFFTKYRKAAVGGSCTNR